MLRKLLCLGVVAFAISTVAWCQNGIQYNGGPIIPLPSVYLIWYGNWSENTALSILPEFVQGLSGSRYFDNNTTYFQSGGQTILNHVTLGPQAFDNYSQGTVLSAGALDAIVQNALQLGALPVDPGGVYFVLTSSDVALTSALTGFPPGDCTELCGLHRGFTYNLNFDIKLAWVGNPERCLNGCGQANSPNQNVGADSMASWMAHEFAETVTDPDINAWYTGTPGAGEVGDKCEAFPLAITNFGPTSTDANGQRYNVTLGGRNFLIQRTWVNFNGGFCGVGVGVPPPLNVAFIEQQYLDFLDRAADPSGLAGWVSNLNSGTTRPEFIQAIMQGQEIASRGKFVEQCYVGLLTRPGDFGGFRDWVTAIQNGMSQLDVVAGFIGSAEFQAKLNGNTSNAAFVTLLYDNFFGGVDDPTGFNGWVNALNNGSLTRAQVALGFLQSTQFLSLTGSQNAVNVGLLYVDMLRRTPDSNGFSDWLSALNSGTPLTSVINGFMTSAEYAARF